MPLEPNIKKVLLSITKKAIDDLGHSDFDGMGTLFSRLVSFADLVADKAWSREFKLIGLVFGTVRGTATPRFEDIDKEKGDKIIGSLIPIFNDFYKALEEEDIQKIDETLKNCAIVFIDEVV